MAEGQGTTPTATQDKKGGATVPDGGSEGSWISKPQQYGNTAGDSIERGMAPVSNTVGKGLETVARPVGGVVDGVLGGVMRAGGAFGETVGVGYGNKHKDTTGSGPAEEKPKVDPQAKKETQEVSSQPEKTNE